MKEKAFCWLQSGRATRQTADSQDTATSRGNAVPSGSLRSAQTWSQGHLRSLASDAYNAALNDSAESKLDIEEGGVSPWKGDKVGLQTVAPILAASNLPSWLPSGPPLGSNWGSQCYSP